MNLSWLMALALVGADGSKAGASPAAIGGDEWRLTLPEAIRIGVKNGPAVRVVEEGDALRVAPRDGGSAWDFKDAVMAHVRSVEQQYWALVEQQIQLYAREMAVKLGEEVVRRERVRLDEGHGHPASLAEARRNVERFQLAYITATSDLMTTERQLRNILGLPPVDNRRIVPATAPVETESHPDWESSLAAMTAHQPNVARRREIVAEAGPRACAAHDAAKSPLPVGLPADVAEDFEARRTDLASARRDALQQAVHESTHSLARFFLEVDANYKQFQTARRVREMAKGRLDAAWAGYEEGPSESTVDRLGDAIAQYADAIGQEGQFKTSYNTSICALGEARGTILEERRIVLAEPKGLGDKPADATGRIAATPISPMTPSRPIEVKVAVPIAPIPIPTATVDAKPKGDGVQMTLSPRIIKNLISGAIGVDFDLKPAALESPAPVPTKGKAKSKAGAARSGGRAVTYDVSIVGGPIPIRLQGTVQVGTSAP